MGGNSQLYADPPRVSEPEPIKNPDEKEPVKGEENLFYVDTKPERSKLSMPKPRMEDSEETKIIDFSTVDDAITHDSIEPKIVREVQSEGTPTVKRLKRRNQEIYANEEDS